MYTGNVHVGGAAQVRELPQLIISKLAVGPMNNNVYLLRCRETGAQVLIDAAAEPDRILSMVGTNSLDMVLTTHAHGDHWQALTEVVAYTGALTVAPTADAMSIPVPTDRRVNHGESVEFGNCHVEVLTVGGHTPGCSMFLYRDPLGHEHLFSGDALFPGGVGKTQTQEDFHALLSGVTNVAFDLLSDLTWVYPGHGQDTTLGAERPQLDDWRQRGW